MGCFTKNRYVFPLSQIPIWEKLILKYYGKFIWDERMISVATNECIIDTGRISIGTVSSKVIPSVDNHPLPQRSDSNIKIDNSILELVDSVIRGRLDMKEKEVFIRSSFESEVNNTFDILCQIKERNSITNWFFSPSKNEVFLLLNNIYPIVITSDSCKDGFLPALDFDKGFHQNSFGSATLYPEWEEDFKIWRKKVDFSSGDHSMDEIIQVRDKKEFI